MAQESQSLPPLSQIVSDLEPGLVCVKTPTSSGSGFVVDYAGNVITNAHVVEHYTNVTLEFTGGNVSNGEVLGTDFETDLACIRVTDPVPLSPVTLGDSESVKVGEDVLVMGYPLSSVLNGAPTVTKGILSAIRPDRLQTDAAINPGSSGGPLVDALGQVIGVNTSVYEVAEGRIIEGIGFAIPIDVVKGAMRALTAINATGSHYGIVDTESTSESWTTYTISTVPLSISVPGGWELFHLDAEKAHFASTDGWQYSISVVSIPSHFARSVVDLESLAMQAEQFELELAAEIGRTCTILSRGWVGEWMPRTWQFSYLETFGEFAQYSREEKCLWHVLPDSVHIVTANLQAPIDSPREDWLMDSTMEMFRGTIRSGR